MVEAEEFVQKAISEIKNTIKSGKAIIAASGGVDSTVAAILCHRAIGKNLTAVHVDTGLMRKNESAQVVEVLKSFGLTVRFVDAKQKFYTALNGITHPEEKRKIIGELFIRIFEEEAEKVKDVQYLIQGTIAPDWIESGGGLRDTIKTHHNVGGLPKEMQLKLVEPLRDLYKDEVREVGKNLEIPDSIVNKQPFPGPGLAVRILGEVTEERAKLLQEADFIWREELEKAANEEKINLPWQYFAVLLPIRTVGVHGDLRAYGYTIGLRAVESFDGMTANFLKIPPELLEKIAIRIHNTLKKDINRVVYDITNKPPSTIEWE
ncbi:TPA: glutamine-hydrolyzing GMP synthase [archaeon]|uniref:GMP synthase (glutamine-hydrolyzing) n=1 Tax=Candidatus Naiadarchaeum limnaeum TaxID=2756139 RepID=A0A832XIL9_9ARCH|nr:glutamine-hydrolyzing GMP synthase [Candidatus Naiadarchaeum limnaeum]